MIFWKKNCPQDGRQMVGAKTIKTCFLPTNKKYIMFSQ